jgi:RHS repeat-associated protein
VRTVTNQTATANNGTTHYVWNIFGQIIAEVNGSTGVTLRETVYLDGMPLAAIDAVASPKKTYAVHTDHLNRPIMLTDSAKTNVWWARYEPFGRVHATGGTLTQNLGLPGQWFQLENGLAYNWHRHYDPTTGRYTTADPLGFVDGPSVFAYARSNPQRFVDPSGLEPSGGGGGRATFPCGRCTITYDSDQWKGAHTHWNCPNQPEGCIKKDGSLCDSSAPPPENVKQCLRDRGRVPSDYTRIGAYCVGAAAVALCLLNPQICVPAVAVGGGLSLGYR